MCYQGSGLNGADGLGLRLKIPKGIKKKVKSLGKQVKKVLRSPITKGAIIGAAGGFIYQKIRQRRAAKLPPLARVPGVPTVRIPTTMPTPVPYIEPPNVPVGPSGLPLPAVAGGPSHARGAPPMALRQAIANKIMQAIPLTPEEMAIVQAGWLGEGMKAAAEAAYGSDAYIPGAGQPLATVTVTGKPDDNTLLYAGLGLTAILLLGAKPKRKRSR